MGSFVINSGGLGAYMLNDCSTGLPIDCDLWANFFNKTCWGMCPDSTIALTLPVAPGTPASLTTIPDTTGQAAQDLSNAAISATQANNAAANPPIAADSCETLTANWPWPFDGVACSTFVLYGVGALALFMVLKVAK